MRFKEWLLKEIGTSTNCVASFKRISIPMVRREWPPEIVSQMEIPTSQGKKKIYMQPQVKE
jgi:hypothetical protein